MVVWVTVLEVKVRSDWNVQVRRKVMWMVAKVVVVVNVVAWLEVNWN